MASGHEDRKSDVLPAKRKLHPVFEQLLSSGPAQRTVNHSAVVDSSNDFSAHNDRFTQSSKAVIAEWPHELNHAPRLAPLPDYVTMTAPMVHYSKLPFRLLARKWAVS